MGKFFFAGTRTFFGSLPAAIFLFSKVAGIPSGSRGESVFAVFEYVVALDIWWIGRRAAV